MYVYIHTHRTIYIRTLHYITLYYSTVQYITLYTYRPSYLYCTSDLQKELDDEIPGLSSFHSLSKGCGGLWSEPDVGFRCSSEAFQPRFARNTKRHRRTAFFSLKSPANIPGWQDVGGIVPKQIINDDIIGNSLSGCICVSPRVSVQPFMSRLSVAVSPINTSPWWTSKLIVIDMIPQIDPGRMSIMAYRIWIIMVNIKILDNYASNGHISVLYQ